MIESLLTTTIELGSIYSLAVLGLALSFRITGFADLTIEGSFTTGAAVSCIAILSGLSPFLSIALAMVAGAVAGSCTALLHTKARVNKLLAGIIMMTALYSVNLRIMGLLPFLNSTAQVTGVRPSLLDATRPNLPILNVATIFTPLGSGAFKAAVLLLTVFLFVILLWLFLSTRFGLFLRATGENPKVVTASGLTTSLFILAGLALSNALIAMCGAIFAQNVGYADIGMSLGLIVSAFASLIIGEAVIRPTTSLRLLLAAVVGSILYQFVIAVGLRFNITPSDLKLATAVLLVLAVVVRKRMQKGRSKENIGCEVL
jgi:putative ABC transport system permease protein